MVPINVVAACVAGVEALLFIGSPAWLTVFLALSASHATIALVSMRTER